MVKINGNIMGCAFGTGLLDIVLNYFGGKR
jgi:hypothetical protein